MKRATLILLIFLIFAVIFLPSCGTVPDRELVTNNWIFNDDLTITTRPVL